MAIFAFVLGLILTTLGCGGLLASVDLLPTEIGVLYAGCGTVAASGGLIILSIGALIRRVDALALALRTLPFEQPPFEALAAELNAEDNSADRFEASEPSAAPPRGPDDIRDEDEPINENRSGHLPTFAELEHAIAEPERPPTLVGRYTAGGANYMIFSDGTIEADTDQGAYRFASMGDFKAYLAGRRR